MTSPNASDMCGLVHRPDSFVAALTSGGDLERVAKAVVSVVDDSFVAHPMRGGSRRITPEWAARRDFAVALFRELQGDLGWTTDRALSQLRPALSARLSGAPWTPGERRALWAPDAGLAAGGLIRVDDVALAPPDPDGVESLSDLKEKLKLGLGIDADADGEQSA